MSEKKEKPRDLTMREIGRRGGQTTASRHGVDHYREIGRRGGLRTRSLIQTGRESERATEEADA